MVGFVPAVGGVGSLRRGPLSVNGRRNVYQARRGVVRALIFTSKDADETSTMVGVSGQDRRGHLLSVSETLDSQHLTIVKGFISSENGSVNDSFVLSKEGASLTEEELVELRGAVEAIESAEEPESTLETKRDVPDHDRTPHVNHDYNSGAYVLVDNQRSTQFTSVTISGPNRTGLFSQLLKVISSYGCNITFGILSTFDYDTSRRHDIIHLVASDGLQVDEPTRIALSNTLTDVLRAVS